MLRPDPGLGFSATCGAFGTPGLGPGPGLAPAPGPGAGAGALPACGPGLAAAPGLATGPAVAVPAGWTALGAAVCVGPFASDATAAGVAGATPATG